MAVGLDRRSEEGQKLRLARVVGLEAACPRDLVQAEPGVAGGAGVLRDAVAVAAVLGDRERDPLAGLARKLAAAKLGAHAGIGTKRRRRAGEDADELGDGAARGGDA